MLKKIRSTVDEYPRNFWVLIGALFIDRVGGALIFPFLSLYITSKFNVGMTEVGAIFAVHSISSFVGNMVGGALTDKFGRRLMLIVGLIFSAGVSLGLFCRGLGVVLSTRLSHWICIKFWWSCCASNAC